MKLVLNLAQYEQIAALVGMEQYGIFIGVLETVLQDSIRKVLTLEDEKQLVNACRFVQAYNDILQTLKTLPENCAMVLQNAMGEAETEFLQ